MKRKLLSVALMLGFVTINSVSFGQCADPSNLQAGNVTATSVNLDANYNGANILEFNVVLHGMSQTAGTPTANTPFVVGDLQPGTDYDFYTRSHCASPLLISGILDADLSGGKPKVIELFATTDIADISNFGLALVTNGNTSNNSLTANLPSVSMTANSYLYITTDSSAFNTYFGFNADFIWGGGNFNGDDRIELYLENILVDKFGENGIDGTNKVWEYKDSWAYRMNGDSATAVFDTLVWNYAGVGAVDNCADNASCGSQFPIGTFTTNAVASGWAGPISFSTPCPSLVFNETVSDISCNGLTDGSIAVAPTGGTTPYSYMWSNGATTASLTGLGIASYSVTATTGNCSESNTFAIVEPSVLTVTGTATNASCANSNDITWNCIVFGGTIPYSYLWNNGETNSIVTGNYPGIGECSVTDASGCESAVSVTATAPSSITITSNVGSNNTCFGDSNGMVSASATGGATTTFIYDWGVGTTAAVTGLSAGNYQVTVTDGNGCEQAGDNLTITEGAEIVLSVSITNATTNLGNDGSASAIINSSSNYSYQWNNVETDQVITGLSTGVYCVTVIENGTGCQTSACGTVTEPTFSCALTVTGTSTDVSCNGGTDGSSMATVSGGAIPYMYEWSSGLNFAVVTGIGAGVYTITVTDLNACTETASITINEPTALTGVGIATICNSDSMLFDNGYQNANGVYTNTLTSINGCDSVVSVTLTVMTGVNAGADAIMDICSTELTIDVATLLDPNADADGNWDGSGIFTILGVTNTSVVVATLDDGANEYTYSVDDENGTACSIDTAFLTVFVYGAPTAGGNQTVSSCIQGTTFNLMDELNNPDNGGTWSEITNSGALTDSIFDIQVAGVGSFEAIYAVAGNSACIADTATLTINVISAPNAGTGSTLEACSSEVTIGLATGLTGQDSGGSWNDDDNTNAILFGNFSPSATGAGTYHFTYTVTSNGCTDDTETVTVEVTTAPDAGGDVSDTICLNGTALDIQTILTGTPDAGGTWSDDGNSGSLVGSVFTPTVATGLYDFTYTVVALPCAEATAVVTLLVEDCTTQGVGVVAVSDLNKIAIYPNPNNGTFMLNVPFVNNWEVEIFDITGKLVKIQQLNDVNTTINLAVEKGAYFMKVSSNSETVTVKRIVIQ